MAMDVLQSATVDVETWKDAAKWLLLYGPPEIQSVLKQSSSFASHEFFPDLKPTGFNEQGEPCYDVRDVAAALGISMEEAAQKLTEMQFEHETQHLFDTETTHKIQ